MVTVRRDSGKPMDRKTRWIATNDSNQEILILAEEGVLQELKEQTEPVLAGIINKRFGGTKSVWISGSRAPSYTVTMKDVEDYLKA